VGRASDGRLNELYLAAFQRHMQCGRCGLGGSTSTCDGLHARPAQAAVSGLLSASPAGAEAAARAPPALCGALRLGDPQARASETHGASQGTALTAALGTGAHAALEALARAMADAVQSHPGSLPAASLAACLRGWRQLGHRPPLPALWAAVACALVRDGARDAPQGTVGLLEELAGARGVGVGWASAGDVLGPEALRVVDMALAERLG